MNLFCYNAILYEAHMLELGVRHNADAVPVSAATTAKSPLVAHSAIKNTDNQATTAPDEKQKAATTPRSKIIGA